MSFPVTVDLMSLAAELEAKGGNRKLRTTLKSAWRAQSCLSDLNLAQGQCELIDELRAQTVSIDQTALVHMQSALMTTAILLYARATSTGGSARERGSIQLKHLTPEQIEDHKALIEIRNRALGHVETSAKIAGDLWHVDYLFAKQAGPSLWQFASASTGIGLNYGSVAMLKRQLPIAINGIRATLNERLNDVQKAVQEVKPDNAVMLRHQVDPGAWFGSPQNAQMFLAGRPGEESFSWMPLI